MAHGVAFWGCQSARILRLWTIGSYTIWRNTRS